VPRELIDSKIASEPNLSGNQQLGGANRSQCALLGCDVASERIAEDILDYSAGLGCNQQL
jgi:hypothetical protein